MRKIIFLAVSIVVIVALVAVFYLRSSSGFRSIYFVPEDAVLIYETKDPIHAWDQIIHSKAWHHFSKNDYFKELNEDILSYDSLVNSSKFLLKLVGKKSITMSQHLIAPNKYEYIYIVDVGKAANSKKPEKIVNSILGKNYDVTSRIYNGEKIVELLDKEESAYYFLTFSKGKLIFSFEPKLIEKAIDASVEMSIGRDMKFIDIQSKIGTKGLFSIYLNYNHLSSLVSGFSAEATQNFNQRTKHMKYTGMYFDIDEDGLISMEGYTSFNDSVPDEVLDIFEDGKNDVVSASAIPLRIASMAKINFEDAQEYFLNAMKNMGEQEYDSYMDNVAKIEKKLKISLEKNLFSWMDKEIIMLQTQPSNLGRSNEFAAILHASDSALASEQLKFIWKQIKKNTPVKVKSVVYKGFMIDYIAFPGIIKALFGNSLEKLEKPYFTQIGDNVILSNHPQTLKNIIDDYLNKSTLSTSVDYYNFNKLFSNNASAYLYCEPPVLYKNLKSFFDQETWQKINTNKEYITCFSQGAVQINKDNSLIHFTLKAQYQPGLKEWKSQFYNSSEIFSLFSGTVPTEPAQTEEVDSLPKLIISDLDADEFMEYYDDGTLKTEVELKDGLKHGDIRQYHPNGELLLKGEYDKDEPTGKWKYYDAEGDWLKTDRY